MAEKKKSKAQQYLEAYEEFTKLRGKADQKELLKAAAKLDDLWMGQMTILDHQEADKLLAAKGYRRML